jgi:hypothetical protein
MALEELAKNGTKDSFMAADDYLDIMHGVTGRALVISSPDANADLRETGAGVWTAGRIAGSAARESTRGTSPGSIDRIEQSGRDLNTSIGVARNRGATNDVNSAIPDQPPPAVDREKIEQDIDQRVGDLRNDPLPVLSASEAVSRAIVERAKKSAEGIEEAARQTGGMIPHDHRQEGETEQPSFIENP